MTATATTVVPVPNPARRGDLAVIASTTSTFFIGQSTTVRWEFVVAEVTSVDRAGRVKAVRTIGWDSVRELRHWVGFEKTYVIPASVIDKPAAIAAVRAHTWPGHPTQVMPFDSLDEVRALLVLFKMAGSAESGVAA